ncbi:glycosyltransferase family 4 protein [Acinetobacter pittii]|uniref:glycosyltransferase family 4 protein n=1 Tax=Acinetobacter pittii TaxID=48296 RepID=UPI000A373D57|nr:glycosyltransferase family 4 protein [Acinetobacter pittii]MCZ1179756.1 glycosyltransferase family 4 protein [Acinetobacter pittii]OTU23677.1 hypothetical protein CAT62_01535 [Acinetobacter pittii]OTU48481.1 hypothetical protein CAT36_19080 [Acinetobacter pittii]
MKNIGFICYNIDESGGLERVTSLITNELSQDPKCQIFIFSLFKGKELFFDFNENIKIIYLESRNLAQKIFELRYFLKKKHIDYLIIVDSLLSFIVIPASLGLKIKCIGWEHYSFNNSIIDRKRKIARYLASNFFYKIIVLTNRDEHEWNRKFNIPNKIVVIRNPSSFYVERHIDKTPYYNVLAVGRLRYEKGFDLLISAWKIAKPNLPDNVRLLIVGEGEEYVNLKSLILKYDLSDSIEIKKFTKNIDNYYKEAKVYCLTSRTEAFPLVLIEALSFSTPLLAMDCYTGPKEIIEEGYNGFLCEENNIKLYAEKLVEIFRMNVVDYSNLSKNAYNSSHKYSVNEIGNIWKNLLNISEV